MQAQAVFVIPPKKLVGDALYNHYYVAESRACEGYESPLKVGPRCFSGIWTILVLCDVVDRFAYQNGPVDQLIRYVSDQQQYLPPAR